VEEIFQAWIPRKRISTTTRAAATAGTIKEVRYDLLKIRGEIDYLRRKEKEE